MIRHLIAARFALALALAAWAWPAGATEVSVIGLFPGKAVVMINKSGPRTLSVGQRSPEGVLLVSVDGRAAVIEVDGRREKLEIGSHIEAAPAPPSRQSVTIAPDARGHYWIDGTVNGAHVRFIVDTGASFVSLSQADAARLAIDYRRGTPTRSNTANGVVLAWHVMLESVTVGGITLYSVDGLVNEGPGFGGGALLGNSFLNRTNLLREGSNLTLTRRY